ncbi:MAG: ACT domain-containing protein [Eubacteriales bacterium]
MAVNVTLRLTGLALSICKLSSLPETDLVGFFSLTGTGKEISLVCETAHVPKTVVRRENGYCAFEVLGPLDLSLIGIVAGITAALAKSRVSVFVVSTFDTDYILVKEAREEKAIEALVGAGYSVVQ